MRVCPTPPGCKRQASSGRSPTMRDKRTASATTPAPSQARGPRCGTRATGCARSRRVLAVPGEALVAETQAPLAELLGDDRVGIPEGSEVVGADDADGAPFPVDD